MNRLLDGHKGDKPSSQCKDGRNAERRGSHENAPLKNPGAAFVQRVRLVLSGYDESATSELKCPIRAKLSQRVGLSPDKGRSQEKTPLLRLEFFLLLSSLARARFVLTSRARCSVAGQCNPVVWVFSTTGFHRFFATKPVSSET